MSNTEKIINALLPDDHKIASDEQQWIKSRILLPFCALAFFVLLIPLTFQLLESAQRPSSILLGSIEIGIFLVMTSRWHRINMHFLMGFLLLTALLSITSFFVYGQFSMFSTAHIYVQMLIVAGVFLVSLRFGAVLTVAYTVMLLWLRYKYLGGDFAVIQPEPTRYWRELIMDSSVAGSLTLGLCWFSTVTRQLLQQKVAKAQDDLNREKISSQEERRRRAVSDLASGVAHEINNPLTIVLGRNFVVKKYLESLETKPPNEILSSVGIINQAAERMAAIVRTIRMLTDPVRSDDVLESAHFHIAKAIELCKVQSEKHHVVVDVNFSGRHDCTLKYGDVFNRSVTFIIDNAILAAAKSETRYVKIDVTAAETLLHVTISDSGGGITLADHESVFDPFVTTRAPGEGLGLGLSVARALAEKAGGTVKLVRPSSPTTFEITTAVLAANAKGNSRFRNIG